MTVLIPKRPDYTDDPEAADWPQLEWWCELDGSVTVACPEGHVGGLDHTISADGTVTPSLVCPEEGCGWHVSARLVNWPPEVSTGT